MRLFILSLLLLAQTFFSWVFPANAQDSSSDAYTILFRNVALEDALEQLVSTTKINLLYDPDLISGIYVTCSSRDKPAESILRCLTTDAELDFYQLSSGTYVLIEKPEEPPKLGDLAGIVVDKSTGEPLPYANVLLADASTGTATNSAGMFTFSSLLTGPHAVVTTYIGYRPSLDSVWVPPDGRIRQRIELEAEPIVADPIVVNGLQQRLPSQDLGLNARDTEDLLVAGSLGSSDPIYSVSSVMNVGVRPPFVDLHIQGGEAGEHQTLLDGVPVFEPVSLGRLMGAFSPLAVGRITVHKAGFGAPIGSQLSGVLHVEQDLASEEFRFFTAQIDPLSVNGRVNVDLDLPGTASSKVMVAARQSYWDIYRYATLNNLLQDWTVVDPILSQISISSLNSDRALFTPHRHGSDVSFSDIHAASSVQLNSFHNLYLSFYRGTNDISSELLTAEATQATDSLFILFTRDQYNWTNSTSQIRHEWLMGARTLGMIRLRNSLHTLNQNYEYLDNQSVNLDPDLDASQIERALIDSLDQVPRPDNHNRIRETALEASFDYSVSKSQHVTAGLEVAQISNRFRLDSQFTIPLTMDYSGWRSAGFIQSTTSIGLQTTIEVGSRFTFIPDRNTVYAEPRASIRHDIPTTPSGSYSFHAAVGLYRQFTNPFDLSNAGPSAAVPSLRLWFPIDETLAPPTAYHITGNMLWMPHDDLQLRFESFFKGQPRILAFDYITILTNTELSNRDVDENEFITETSGYAFGAGFYVEQTFERSVASIQYSYSLTKRRYENLFTNDRFHTTPWNEPHRVTLSQDVFITPRFTARLRANGTWGRAWGFRQAYYDYIAAHNGHEKYDPYLLNNPSDDKLPPIYQLDAGLSYEREFSDVKVQVRADVLNILDRKHVVDRGLQSIAGTEEYTTFERVMPGITTALSLRVRF